MAIENDNQLSVTRQRIIDFDNALVTLKGMTKEELKQLHPTLHKAQIDAIESVRNELEDEVNDYVNRRGTE